MSDQCENNVSGMCVTHTCWAWTTTPDVCLQARVEDLEEQSRRWYNADGSFDVLDPVEVVKRRIAAAAEIRDVRRDFTQFLDAVDKQFGIGLNIAIKMEMGSDDDIAEAKTFKDLFIKMHKRWATPE